MAARLRARVRGERGQATVEFAIVVPVMVLIVMAIVQFGLLFESGLAVSEAAKAGAQVAAFGGTSSEVQAAAVAVTTADGVQNVTVTSETAPSSLGLPTPGVEVTVSAQVPVIVPDLPFLGSSVPVSTTTVMLDDGPPSG